MNDNREVKEQFRITTLGGGVASKPLDHYPTKDEIEAFMKSMPPNDMYFQVEKIFSLVAAGTLPKEPNTVAGIAEAQFKQSKEDWRVRQILEVKISEHNARYVVAPKRILMTFDQGRALLRSMGINQSTYANRYDSIPISYTNAELDEPMVCF